MKSQQDLEKKIVLLKVAPMHHEECKILRYAPCHPDWGTLMVVFRMKVYIYIVKKTMLRMIEDHILSFFVGQLS